VSGQLCPRTCRDREGVANSYGHSISIIGQTTCLEGGDVAPATPEMFSSWTVYGLCSGYLSGSDVDGRVRNDLSLKRILQIVGTRDTLKHLVLVYLCNCYHPLRRVLSTIQAELMQSTRLPKAEALLYFSKPLNFLQPSGSY
jgi:hypothetical protein